MVKRILPLVFLIGLSALSGCVMLAVQSESPGALNASGARINAHPTGVKADLGRYRLTLNAFFTARVNPIPPTLMFFFEWSPAEMRRIHRARGYKTPTEADWVRDTERDRATSRSETRAFEARRARYRAEVDASDDEYVVWPNGAISTCGQSNPAQKWCAPAPSLSRATQIRLAQQARDLSQPGCRLGRIDPPEVAALMSESRANSLLSGPRRLVAEILCPETR